MPSGVWVQVPSWAPLKNQVSLSKEGEIFVLLSLVFLAKSKMNQEITEKYLGKIIDYFL
jgi:hypothetical protein